MEDCELTFHQIIDGISALITVTTADGKIALVNRHGLGYVGKPLDELKAWTTSDVIHPHDLPLVIAAWQQSVRLGQPYQLVHRIRRVDIEQVTHVASIAIERAQAESALKQSEAFLEEAQHLNRTGSFLWRAATDEITWSKEMYHIYEFSESEPVTLERANARVHPDDLAMYFEQIARAKRESGEVDFDVRLRFPDGSIKYLHVVSHGSRDESGDLVYTGAVQDITERRRAQDTLGKGQAELAHVARVSTLGALTASIAHEVNQPVSGILLNASTCSRKLADDPPDLDGARDAARRTIRDARRTSDVIERVRALFAKKDTTAQPVDLNDAIREVFALTLSELQRNRVVLRQELADGLPLVMGDRIQLQQVVLNLVLNASQAMRRIDDRPRDLIVRTERDEGDGVRLSVQDAGVGFAPDAADKLFEAF